MLWLVLIYASVPFVLIVGGVLAHKARQIRLTRWGLPVLFCAWLLSLRVVFIMLICGYLFAAATGGGRPAFWLRELWAVHSWPLALLGIAGLVAVFALRGIRPVSRRSGVICLTVALVLVGLSTAWDAFLFRFAYSRLRRGSCACGGKRKPGRPTSCPSLRSHVAGQRLVRPGG